MGDKINVGLKRGKRFGIICKTWICVEECVCVCVYVYVYMYVYVSS